MAFGTWLQNLPDTLTEMIEDAPDRNTRVAVATIEATESLSDAVDLADSQLHGIIMPAAWDAANLTFQVSNAIDGTYVNLYDDAGNETTVTAAAGRAIAIDVAALQLAPWRYLRVRSGTSGTAVAQAAERTLTLIGKV